jgi:hypothetical protein
LQRGSWMSALTPKSGRAQPQHGCPLSAKRRRDIRRRGVNIKARRLRACTDLGATTPIGWTAPGTAISPFLARSAPLAHPRLRHQGYEGAPVVGGTSLHHHI